MPLILDKMNQLSCFYALSARSYRAKCQTIVEGELKLGSIALIE